MIKFRNIFSLSILQCNLFSGSSRQTFLIRELPSQHGHLQIGGWHCENDVVGMYQNKQRLYCHVRYQILFLPGSFCNRRTHEFDFWLYYVLWCSKSVTPSHSDSAPYQTQTYPSLAVMSRLITAGCRHTCCVLFSAGALKRCSPVGTTHNGFVVLWVARVYLLQHKAGSYMSCRIVQWEVQGEKIN